MKEILGALQFLTIFRVKKATLLDAERFACSGLYFSLIGAVLGLVLICLNKFLGIVFPEPLLSLILVITLIILSGALHIDGLADTCDAVFSGKDKQGMLAIMRDSHKGTFGVLGIITVIMLKTYLLALLQGNFKNSGLFLMTVLSRYSMSLAIFLFPYARTEGKAKIFFENKTKKIFLLSTLVALVMSALTLKLMGLIILFLAIVFTLIIGSIIERKIGGVTGDTLGALSELNELLVLLSVFLLRGYC